MNLREKFSTIEHIGTDWRRLFIRGALMLVIGIFLVFATMFKHDVKIMQVSDLSWLPICGYIVLTVGVLECFDAIIAKRLEDFFLNLQNGVLDVVVACLIILSIGDDPNRLSLLIAAFLIIKGIFRLTLTYATRLPNIVSTSVGAVVSIILGVLIWLEWPSSAGWFLAFCLSTEIALRGWAVMMFGFWIKAQKKQQSESY
ncbi:MAG: HdeD family acid-resistance protein [Methylovulum sp.]